MSSERKSKPRYTCHRTRKNKTERIGPIHGSDERHTTLCGMSLEPNECWWILTFAYNGEVTCKECLKVLRNREDSKFLQSLKMDHAGNTDDERGKFEVFIRGEKSA